MAGRKVDGGGAKGGMTEVWGIEGGGREWGGAGV